MYGKVWAEHSLPLAPRLFSFPFFSTTPSLFLPIFPGKLRGNRQILGSEPSLRLVWAQNQPNLGQIGKIPGILQRTRVYLEFTLRPPGYFVDFLNFASDFAPDQLSDSGVRETRDFPEGNSRETEWSTKHPLFSLEISGNAKCWGPSVFLFVFRKTWPSPTLSLSLCTRHAAGFNNTGENAE